MAARLQPPPLSKTPKTKLKKKHVLGKMITKSVMRFAVQVKLAVH